MKSLDDFPRRSDSADGRRNRCRACGRDYQRTYEAAWRAANPDKTRAKADRYTTTHRSQERARHRRYDAKNRAKRREAMARRRAANPDYDREMRRKWREANPDRMRDYAYRYLNSVRNTDTTTTNYIAMLLDDPCSYCGASANHIDHIEPRSSGGVHHWTNLTASCGSCNSSKGTKPLTFWLAV